MQALILWTHAIAALLFAVLAVVQVRRASAVVPALPFGAALGLTALWLLAVAGIGFSDVATRLAEGLRHLGWLGFMYALVRWSDTARRSRPIAALYGVVAAVFAAAMILAVLIALEVPQPAATATAAERAIGDARLGLRLMAVLGALLLTRHLYGAVVPRSRGGLRLAVLAIAALWAIDLSLYAATWFAGRWPDSLVVARGFALIVLVPVFAAATQRGTGTLQISRTVAIQSLSIVAVGLYVALTGVATALLGEFGGSHARILQTALVCGSAAAALTIASTPWLRAWTKVIVAKHLFAHRYDYRAEWLRFTATLGAPGGEARSLDERVVKAIADLTDSPAGLLLVPEGEGLGLAERWNWPGSETRGGGAALAAHLVETRRIVALDPVRAGRAPAGEAAAVPAWLIEAADAWAIVPLVHAGRLAGAIVLARPPVDRPLDWEDFDLLGAAGRQAASYLAEDRAHAALAEAARFDEFNRRFAFILHDLKNLVSQLTLVARNAERHADNPAFRADMVATLRDSSDRMTALLARLSQHGPRSAEPVGAVPVQPLLERVARTRRAQHEVRIVGDTGSHVAAEPQALETIIGHLVQNAIEASPAGEAVTLAVSRVGEAVAIDIIDRGAGMSPAFVRDRLFKPFDSSKPGGFGIGAFEARKLAEAMGGTVQVASREGEGSRFRLLLAAAEAGDLEAAA